LFRIIFIKLSKKSKKSIDCDQRFLACRPYSYFDDDAEEANVRANVDVASGHADARASAVMTDNDNDHDANDVDSPDNIGKILGATFMA